MEDVGVGNLREEVSPSSQEGILALEVFREPLPKPVGKVGGRILPCASATCLGRSLVPFGAPSLNLRLIL